MGRWACRLNDRPEKKFKLNDGAGGSAALNAVALDADAEIIDNALVTIATGDGPSNRDGRQICLTRASYKGVITVDTQSGTTANGRWLEFVRFYLVQDTQCNGGAATVSSTTSGIFTQANLFRAFRTPFCYGRFKILAQKTIRCSEMRPVSNNVDQQQTPPYRWPFQMYWHAKPGKGIPIEYSSTTGAITERISNNVFLVAGTSGLSDDTFSVTADSFINYYDM